MKQAHSTGRTNSSIFWYFCGKGSMLSHSVKHQNEKTTSTRNLWKTCTEDTSTKYSTGSSRRTSRIYSRSNRCSSMLSQSNYFWCLFCIAACPELYSDSNAEMFNLRMQKKKIRASFAGRQDTNARTACRNNVPGTTYVPGCR